MVETAPAPDSRRLEFLDGLRGIAALVVVIGHFFSMLLPRICGTTSAWTGWPMVPFLLLTNASFAVFIFFVLSGFVLSRSASERKVTLSTRLIMRYLRLTLPMLVSLIYAWLLFHQFPSSRFDLNRIEPSPWILQVSVPRHVPAIGSVLRDGLYRVYRTKLSLFNSVVWTMKSELWGSCAIYIFYSLCPARYRGTGLGLGTLLLGVLKMPTYMAFFLGALLREIWQGNRLKAGAWIWLFFGVSLTLSLLPRAHQEMGEGGDLLKAVSAFLLILSVLTLPLLREILSARWPQFLGRISFSLYLLHLPLLFTAGAWLYLHLALAGWAIYLSMTVTFCVFIPASILLAWLMTCAIDEPLVSRLHRLKTLRWRPRGLSPTHAGLD